MLHLETAESETFSELKKLMELIVFAAELQEHATCKEILQVQIEDTREVVPQPPI